MKLPHGHLTIKQLDAVTGEVLSTWSHSNIIVAGAQHALINGIATTATIDNEIKYITLGNDLGELMTGTPNITFAAGPPGTITRDTGSFLTDGFLANDYITIQGSAANSVSTLTQLPLYNVSTVTSTVMTLQSGSLVLNGNTYNYTDTFTAEGPESGVAISRGSTLSPSAPYDTYTNTTMADDSFGGAVVFTAPYTLTVGVINSTTLSWNVVIGGSDVLAAQAGSPNSVYFTSASLNCGDDSVFAYQRFPYVTVSAVVNISVSWSCGF